MDPLRRAAAPVSERAWKALDEAATRAARHVLAGRRIADFDGPHGWEHVAVRLGTTTPCEAREGTATVCVPDMAPLAEIRTDFTIRWAALRRFDEGAPAFDARPAETAAREVALAEDRLVLYGEPLGHGFLSARESPAVTAHDWSKSSQVVDDVLKAVEALDGAGVGGPYELLLPPARYYAYLAALDEGYPTRRHLGAVIERAQRVIVMREAGAFVSTRGGDFVLTVGGDLSIGYRGHDTDAVHLFCVETVAGQVVTPEAVCLLRV